MQLKELIKDMEVIDMVGNLDLEVSGIAYHTKDVRPGCCFVAITGTAADGHDYIDVAIENGAATIVSSKRVELITGIANVVVENPRRVLAMMSARFFNEPSKSLKLVGITGTNGKTTITYLMESIWKVAGFATGVVGTINYRYGSVLTNPKHTTPESYELQKLFRDMVGSGVKCVAMEVSSHSLAQNRVFGCHFDGAIFTNLTQDHLDYHLDMERYKAAKARLFRQHLVDSKKNDVWAAINIDDAFGRKLSEELPYKIYTYSAKKDADVFAKAVKYSFSGTEMKIRVGRRSLDVRSNLIGMHNASNILGAVTAAYAMGLKPEMIKAGIESVKRIPGRLEPVPNSKGLNVFIDYAHTPDALRNVTTALKELKPKRLITVFGCGGDRDKTKRPLMGYETALRSDFLIITSDNPRTENPQKIMDEIVTGVRRAGLEEGKVDGGYMVEIDRGKAIRTAVKAAGPEDVVLIAGKGHENYQIIGLEKYSFDDLKITSEVIESN